MTESLIWAGILVLLVIANMAITRSFMACEKCGSHLTTVLIDDDPRNLFSHRRCWRCGNRTTEK